MLAAYDTDEGTEFRIKYTKSKIKKILEKNLPADNRDFISYENLNKAKGAFGKLFDVGGSFPYFKNRADELQTLNTSEITRQSVSATSLKREGMCFFTAETINSLEGDEKATLKEIIDNEEEYKIKEIYGAKLKTALNCLVSKSRTGKKICKNIIPKC